VQYVDINDGTVRLPVDVGGPERLYDVEGDAPRFVAVLTRPCADELGLPPTCALTEYKTFRPQVDSPQVVSPPSRFAPSRFAPKTTEGKLNKLIYFPYRFTAWTCLKNAF
jgi:hypothetical protein